MEKPRHRTFVMSDTISKAYMGWMKSDFDTSFNLATLAMWRSDNYELWLTPDEERFLTVAINHPPLV